MTEINPNYGNPIERNNPVHAKKGTDINNKEIKGETAEQKYTPDTGVLGRSQVKSAKGGNITQSINETLQTPKSVLMLKGGIFEEAYNEFINEGMPEDKAYFAALAFTNKLCS